MNTVVSIIHFALLTPVVIFFFNCAKAITSQDIHGTILALLTFLFFGVWFVLYYSTIQWLINN